MEAPIPPRKNQIEEMESRLREIAQADRHANRAPQNEPRNQEAQPWPE